MRRLLAPVLMLGAAALLAVSAAAADGSSLVAGAGVRGDALITISAHGTGDGVTAAGRVRIKTDTRDTDISVSCIRHVGDLVLVGGRVTAATAPPGPSGDWGAVVVIADQGPAGTDQVGFGFEIPPATASSLDCTVNPSVFTLAPLVHGNFATK